MKKRFSRVIFALLVCVILSQVVFALGESNVEKGQEFDPQSFDWADGDYSKVSDWSVVSPSLIVRWGDVPDSAYSSMDFSSGQEKVPVTKINKIPPEVVDVSKVQDQSKLTKDQLLFGKNVNKVSDVRALDEGVLREVLSEHASIGVQLQAGDSGTKVTLKDGGIIEVDKGTTLSVGDTINKVDISGFKNARYANGFLSAESGASATQKKNDEVLTSTQSFRNLVQDTKKNSMIVDSAQQIMTRYSTVNNVKRTFITQKDDSTTILSLEKQDFSLNHGGEEFRVNAERQGSVTFGKDVVKAEKVVLSFPKKFKLDGSYLGSRSDEVQSNSTIQCASCSAKIVKGGRCWMMSQGSSYSFSIPSFPDYESTIVSLNVETPDLFCVLEDKDKENVPCTSQCSVFRPSLRMMSVLDAGMNLTRLRTGNDPFIANLSGTYLYSFLHGWKEFVVSSDEIFSGDIIASSSLQLRKTTEWSFKSSFVEFSEPQNFTMYDNERYFLQYENGTLIAREENDKMTMVHKPGEPLTFPLALASVPLLLPAFLLFGRRKAQVSTYMILGIVLLLVLFGTYEYLQNSTDVFSVVSDPASSTSYSCAVSSVKVLEDTIARSGSATASQTYDSTYNISILYASGKVFQRSLDGAKRDQERALAKEYSSCVGDFSSVKGVTGSEKNVSVTAEYYESGTGYLVRPNAVIKYSTGSDVKIDKHAERTGYPYKLYHETTATFLNKTASTGFSPIFPLSSLMEMNVWTSNDNTMYVSFKSLVYDSPDGRPYYFALQQ